ncbi:hypothetical protein, partial [Glaciecola sp. MH2013]|uniref:hypothetical protein n=1 Tax=Glaciecola sp. MH2013 TaxID=2785524 RepID=UPI001E340691
FYTPRCMLEITAFAVMTCLYGNDVLIFNVRVSLLFDFYLIWLLVIHPPMSSTCLITTAR